MGTNKKAIGIDTMLVGAKPITLLMIAVFYLLAAFMPEPANRKWAELWKLCTGQGTAVMMGFTAFTIMMVPGGWPSWRQSVAAFGAMLFSVGFIIVGAMVGGPAALVGLVMAIAISPLVYVAFCRMTGHRHLVNTFE